MTFVGCTVVGHSPGAAAPGSVACEVLKAAAWEISGLYEPVGEEVSPSHTPAPSVHKTRRQLGHPEQ